MYKYIFILAFFSTYLFSNSTTILSAANLKFFFEDLTKEYNKQYPNDKIDVEFDSSGNISDQILKGKNYDIFLSANMTYPKKVYNNNKSATKPKKYTTGALILLISTHKGLSNSKLDILKDDEIKEITIANKKTAPYGVAAIQALKNANLYDKIKSKLYYSTNASNIIGDVLWYGHVGILPKSAINSLPRGYNMEGENWIEIDQKLYDPIVQGYTLSEHGIKNDVSNRFIKFLLSDGQKIFKKNGYK
ncbi:MAG: molybdate ABC transporter substrate-binding protein [Campylobacterota bacterium]|nr:molybdate ABC transporter substrate-binding protein [Campylobacterota bacterium]